jgi:tetratricopeptide (TPR) repeat protein
MLELAVSTVISPSPWLADPTLVDQLLNRAVRRAENGDLGQATADLDEALKLNPESPLARYNRGRSYAEAGNHSGAISEYGTAIRLNPKLADAFNNRGLAYFHTNRIDLAIVDYGKAIDLNPDLAEAFNNRGIAYCFRDDVDLFYKQDADLAISDFTKAIQLRPNFAVAWNNRGAAYHARNQRNHAMVDFAKAITIDPILGESVKESLRGVSREFYDRLLLYIALFEGRRLPYERKPNEFLKRYLASVGVVDFQRPQAMEEIRKVVGLYSKARVKWDDRHNSDDLKDLNAPLFLRKVYHDAFDRDGNLVDAELVRRSDPKLVKAVQQFIIKREERERDLGDAKGLTFARQRGRGDWQKRKGAKPGRRRKRRMGPAPR